MKPASPDDTRQILEGISAVTRKLARASGGPDEGPPMTSTQRLALFETAVGGPLRLSELAERMGITAPTASRAVDGLVELGLLERLPDPADRRAVSIDVTAPGRSARRGADRPGGGRPRAGRGGALRPDRARLAALLARLAGAIEP